MPWMTIPIAMGIAGAGSAAAGIYSSKRAADTNDKALQAGERDADRAAADSREERAFKERLYQQQVEADKQRWADYVRIHEPHWQMGQGVLGSLYNMAGVQPPPSPPPSAPPTAGMAPPAGPMVDATRGGAGVWSNPGAPTSLTDMARGGTVPMMRRQQAMPAPAAPTAPRAQGMSLADIMALADYGRG